MHTSNTAPGRPRINRFTLAEFRVTKDNQAYYDIEVADETGAAAGTLQLFCTFTRWCLVQYDASGKPVVVEAAAPAGALGADFTAFTATAGAWAPKAAALEARLASTGRFPA